MRMLRIYKLHEWHRSTMDWNIVRHSKAVLSWLHRSRLLLVHSHSNYTGVYQ